MKLYLMTAASLLIILFSGTGIPLEYPAARPLEAGSQAPLESVRRDGPLTIAFLPPASTLMFYQPIGQGILDVAKQHNARVISLAPTSGTDTFGQAGMIQDAIGQEVDAIIITAHDEHAVAPLLKRGVESGIITVLVNSDIPSFPTPIQAVVGYSQRDAMCALGLWLSSRSANRALQVGYLEGQPGYHNTERLEGFRSGITGATVSLVQTISGGWTVDGGNVAAMDLLQVHPNIDGIVAANDDMALGAIQSARALRKDLLITGVDGQTAALAEVEGGRLTATVDANPFAMGQIAASVVLDIAAGTFPGGFVATPTAVVHSGGRFVPPADDSTCSKGD